MCVSLSANNRIVVLGRHVSGCVLPFMGDTSVQFSVTHPSWAAPVCLSKCQPWLDIMFCLFRTQTFKVVANQRFPFSGEHGWPVWADHDWKPPKATVWSGGSGNLQVTRVPGQSRFWALALHGSYTMRSPVMSVTQAEGAPSGRRTQVLNIPLIEKTQIDISLQFVFIRHTFCINHFVLCRISGKHKRLD